MEFCRIIKPSFSVIGKEGSTNEGPGFIPRLWEEANAHFGEVADLAKTEADGTLCGIWGVMSDFSRNFAPWESQYSQGLYLAGVEAKDDAPPPPGWRKWIMPASEYVRIKAEGDAAAAFAAGIRYLSENGLTLVGAAYDHNAPGENGQSYVFLPIRRLV